MPFLLTTETEVRACAECAAQLARGEKTPLVNVGPWPLLLLCEHEHQAELQAAMDDMEGWEDAGCG